MAQLYSACHLGSHEIKNIAAKQTYIRRTYYDSDTNTLTQNNEPKEEADELNIH